jgi:hypothetical protein
MRQQECEHGVWTGFRYSRAEEKTAVFKGFSVRVQTCTLCGAELGRSLVVEPGVWTAKKGGNNAARLHTA